MKSIRGYDANGNEVWRDVSGAEETNLASLVTKANNALAANQTFLAIASPTTAQVATQTKALTRQVNGLLHFLLGTYSDISDT